jgi:LysM repeat protein
MPGASSIPAPQTALRLAYAHGTGSRSPSSDTAFGAALAQAGSASSDAATHGTIPTRIATGHLVKPGDTLYGIANARLAATGQRADPGASMRYALQIAQTNGIRDPNRIHAGQSLDLSIAPASAQARIDRAISTAGGSPPSSAPLYPSGRTAIWETRIIEDARPDDADVHSFDIADVDEPVAAVSSAARPSDESLAPQPTEAAALLAIARYSETAATTTANRPATDPASTSTTVAATEAMPDILYKGLVGKVLDALPLDASARTGLQQANAIIGSSFAGRTIAALTGVGGPLLTLAGLAWGLFSAQKIGAAQPAEAAPVHPPRPELTAARD